MATPAARRTLMPLVTISVAALLTMVLLGLVLVFPGPARAHWADMTVAEIAVEGAEARITLTFPTGLAAGADDDRNGRLTADEIHRHRRDLEAFLGNRITLTVGERPGVLTVEPAEGAARGAAATVAPGATAPGPGEAPATHSTVRLVFVWPQPVRTLKIQYGLFLPGVSTASCLATILEGGRVRSFVFTPEHRDLTLTIGGSAVWQQAAGFVVLGIRHILTGYDHVLFLLTLLMLGGGLKHLLKVVTAFTVAHSVTLTLAVLDLVTLPSRLVESGIALSIACVAAENLWRKEASLRGRWLVTFGFGLIHGLGFASILRELTAGGSNLAVSLVSFNLGVEIGQIIIVAGAALALAALRRLPWEGSVRRLVSAGAMVTGLVWFVQRVGL